MPPKRKASEVEDTPSRRRTRPAAPLAEPRVRAAKLPAPTLDKSPQKRKSKKNTKPIRRTKVLNATTHNLDVRLPATAEGSEGSVSEDELILSPRRSSSPTRIYMTAVEINPTRTNGNRDSLGTWSQLQSHPEPGTPPQRNHRLSPQPRLNHQLESQYSEPSSFELSVGPKTPSRKATITRGLENRSPPKMKSFNISDSALPSRFHNCFNKQKRAILRMLQKPPNLVYEDEGDQPPTNDVAIEQLAHLLEGTVLRGEGNSCLVLGPRGSGKTHLVEDCISGLPGNPIILRLSGWIQHTDRLAMQEIAYQLTQQTGTAFLAPSDDNDPEGPRSNQPTGDDVNPFLDAPQDDATRTGLPHVMHLPALITLLPTLGRPTIIILDGFDLFALHPRQSLLYCLLDTVQTCRGGVSSKGIAILGVTTRLDTINVLEKRVKSRFSGRIFRTAAPNNVDSWITFSRHAFCSIPEGAKDTHTAEWAPLWHRAVEGFLSDATVLDLLRESFGVSRDLKSLCRILIPLVIGLSPSSPFPTHPQLAKAVSSQHSRPRFPYLHALPYPAICLLIAYAHADTAGHQIFTFEMLHEYFRDQLRASLSAPVQINGGSIGMVRCTREVLMRAFESLISINIFIYTTAPSASIPKEFIKCRCAIRHDDVKKAVEKTGQINLKKWLHKAQ